MTNDELDAIATNICNLMRNPSPNALTVQSLLATAKANGTIEQLLILIREKALADRKDTSNAT